jgi:DNA-binding IclR family transcriptional regulator
MGDGNGEREGRGPLLSLLNGIKVLEAFTIAEPVLGVNEIARRVQLHKSTVSRILGTLEQVQLVERDEQTSRFRLGLGVIGLAGPLLAHLDVRRIAYAELQELVSLTAETAALAVWSDHQTVIIDQVSSPRLVKHTTPLGARFNKASSASVQVFLAQSPMSVAQRLRRDGAIEVGPATSDDDLIEQLAAVRERGYAVNDGATDPEELSIAAPVFDHRQEVVAAILLSAPRARATEFLVNDWTKRVIATAETVSARLGAHQLPPRRD